MRCDAMGWDVVWLCDVVGCEVMGCDAMWLSDVVNWEMTCCELPREHVTAKPLRCPFQCPPCRCCFGHVESVRNG